MTRIAIARVAGFAFLFYIAAGIADLVLFKGSGMASTLAGIAQQASAVTLAMTLYILTRPVGPGIATAAMICRLAEGLLGTIAIHLLHVGWSVTISATFAGADAAGQSR